MARSQKPEKKWRGIGCAICLLIVTALLCAAAFILPRVWQAKSIEQELNERFGEATDFVPAADGSITSERIEAFLRVRQRLGDHCVAMQDNFGIVARLEQLEQDQDLFSPDDAEERLEDAKGLLGFGSTFIRFMEARNQALLDEEMGLGEYLYIYVLAYAEQLRGVQESPLKEVEQASVGNRARAELIQILRNQLEALEAGTGSPELAAGLREQIGNLAAGQQKLPWEDGLPPAIGQSLDPYAESLANSYCPGIAKIELSQKNKGLNVKN